MGLGWPESWAGCQPTGQVQVRIQEVGRGEPGAREQSNMVDGSLGAWWRGWSRRGSGIGGELAVWMQDPSHSLTPTLPVP